MIDELIEHLKAEEGVKLKPYRCTQNRLTIGVGRNLDDVGISEEEADILLMSDIRRVHDQLDRNFPWWRGLSTPRRIALSSMCFQLGLYGLSKFKNMLAAMEAEDWDEAATQALDSLWARQTPGRAGRLAKKIREG